jgi:hypothetical protein
MKLTRVIEIDGIKYTPNLLGQTAHLLFPWLMRSLVRKYEKRKQMRSEIFKAANREIMPPYESTPSDKPEFTVNGLEFSKTLPGTYTWDVMMSANWPNGWRVPKKWELMMLYEEEPRSRCRRFYWAASPFANYDGIAFGVNFSYGRNHFIVSDGTHHIRLVRDINQ